MSLNLPPGCRTSDLPGWDEVWITIDLTCPDCGHTETETDACAIPGQTDVLVECPACKGRWFEPLDAGGE